MPQQGCVKTLAAVDSLQHPRSACDQHASSSGRWSPGCNVLVGVGVVAEKRAVSLLYGIFSAAPDCVCLCFVARCVRCARGQLVCQTTIWWSLPVSVACGRYQPGDVGTTAGAQASGGKFPTDSIGCGCSCVMQTHWKQTLDANSAGSTSQQHQHYARYMQLQHTSKHGSCAWVVRYECSRPHFLLLIILLCR